MKKKQKVHKRIAELETELERIREELMLERAKVDKWEEFAGERLGER